MGIVMANARSQTSLLTTNAMKGSGQPIDSDKIRRPRRDAEVRATPTVAQSSTSTLERSFAPTLDPYMSFYLEVVDWISCRPPNHSFTLWALHSS